MEIEIITTSAVDNKLDPTRNFAIALNRIVSSIKMSHWYSCNYNMHVILGDLYDDLTNLFDKLQEEVIGTVNSYDSIFPLFNFEIFVDKDINLYRDDESIINHFYNTSDKLKELLTCLEFNGFIDTVKSGLTNTKEEIISRINKSIYLLSMIKN
jgi:hypothetical protein